MRHLKILLIAALPFLFTGCMTPYQPKSATGGYSEIKIDDQTWRVKFDGNGKTPKEVVWNYWIYRCASLTLEKGYTAMTLHSAKSNPPTGEIGPSLIQRVPYAANGMPPMNKLASARDARWPMNNGVYYPSENDRLNFQKTKGYSGGYTYYYVPGGTYTITTWHSDGIVRMFTENSVPSDVPAWLRAATIVELLKPYVESGGKVTPPTREYIIGSAMVVNVPGKSY